MPVLVPLEPAPSSHCRPLLSSDNIELLAPRARHLRKVSAPTPPRGHGRVPGACGVKGGVHGRNLLHLCQ